MQTYPMKTIARIRTDFPTKFGVPRQSGLVESLTSKIVFEPEFRVSAAFRELEQYSHIWLIWCFSANVRPDNAASGNICPESVSPVNIRPDNVASGNIRPENAVLKNNCPENTVPVTHRLDWSPTVRPPRLGGNRRVGVFATRSPFRPNPIGLSCVRLLRVEPDTPEGPVLWVAGADLMDGTPIFDIKPYLPYTDSRSDASEGFAGPARSYALRVDCPPGLLERVPEQSRDALLEVLSEDPRPHYQDDPDRVYGFGFAGLEVRFSVSDGVLTVLSVEAVNADA